MGFEHLDHTGDLGVALAAATLEGLFAEAAVALCDCITDSQSVVPRDSRSVRAAASNHEELLVEWLQELLYVFETEGLLFSRASVELDESPGGSVSLRGRLSGERFDPERHPLRTAIKAVTYHGLEIRQEGTEWRGRVIFDI